MKPDKSSRPKRKLTRLKDYDYSASGWYYVTICTHNRLQIFGEIVSGEMRLNQFGKIVKNEWLKTPLIRKNVSLDKWQIMPNHLHTIVVITRQISKPTVGAYCHTPASYCHTPPFRRSSNIYVYGNKPNTRVYGNKPLRRMFLSPSNDLGAIIRGFKSTATKQINIIRKTPDRCLWQRNFYEHVIRNENDLDQIRQYINDNPQKWAEDQENPENLPPSALSRQKVITCSK